MALGGKSQCALKVVPFHTLRVHARNRAKNTSICVHRDMVYRHSVMRQRGVRSEKPMTSNCSLTPLVRGRDAESSAWHKTTHRGTSWQSVRSSEGRCSVPLLCRSAFRGDKGECRRTAQLTDQWGGGR